MELGTTRHVPQEKFPRKPYNKSFTDQVFFGQDGWILASFVYASLWTSTPSRSTNMQKKELGQYPAILTSRFVNNPYNIILSEKENIKRLFIYIDLKSALSVGELSYGALFHSALIS